MQKVNNQRTPTLRRLGAISQLYYRLSSTCCPLLPRRVSLTPHNNGEAGTLRQWHIITVTGRPGTVTLPPATIIKMVDNILGTTYSYRCRVCLRQTRWYKITIFLLSHIQGLHTHLLNITVHNSSITSNTRLQIRPQLALPLQSMDIRQPDLLRLRRCLLHPSSLNL